MVDMRKVVEALGFEPDNHHNALLCPYCQGNRSKIEREVKEQVIKEIEVYSDSLNGEDALNHRHGLREAIKVISGSRSI